jgi:hypothetical protein
VVYRLIRIRKVLSNPYAIFLGVYGSEGAAAIRYPKLLAANASARLKIDRVASKIWGTKPT